MLNNLLCFKTHITSHASLLHSELLPWQQNYKGYLPCRIWLNGRVKFFNNSVIYKDIELKFGMD